MADPCVGRITHQCHLIEEDKKMVENLKKKKLFIAIAIVRGHNL